MLANVITWIFGFTRVYKELKFNLETMDRLYHKMVKTTDTLFTSNKELQDKVLTADIKVHDVELQLAHARAQLEEAMAAAAIAIDRLEMIKEKVTPSANATVRKMAQIADEAIKEITADNKPAA